MQCHCLDLYQVGVMHVANHQEIPTSAMAIKSTDSNCIVSHNMCLFAV